MEREDLMKKYAELCGFKQPPKVWKPDNFSVSGWEQLIKRHPCYNEG